MNVLDSSCWLEFAKDSSIGNAVAPIVIDVECLLVPTIVLYEVFKKLSAVEGIVYANKFIQEMLTANVVPLNAPLSMHAANISRELRLPMADSIIYATTKQYDAVLWTTDQHFDGLPNVRYFDKTQH